MLYLLLISFILHNGNPPPRLMVFDMQFKKPVHLSESFSDGDLFNGYFPVYNSDLAALNEACHKAGKLIDTNTRCNVTDTLYAGHTTMRIYRFCNPLKAITVVMITELPGKRIAYHLAENEENSRRAEVSIADLAGYINKELITAVAKPQL